MRSKSGTFQGRSDSPMWKRGNFSRSKTMARWPIRAISVAKVEPPGPPPQTTASASAGKTPGLASSCPRPHVHADEPRRGHEDVRRARDRHRRPDVPGYPDAERRRNRRPPDVVVPDVPRHPCWSPDGARDPDPAVGVRPAPRAVVVRVTAPRVVRHPGPAVLGVEPLPVQIRLPIPIDSSGAPTMAVASHGDPVTVRAQLVVEGGDADAAARVRAAEGHRERNTQGEDEGKKTFSHLLISPWGSKPERCKPRAGDGSSI